MCSISLIIRSNPIQSQVKRYLPFSDPFDYALIRSVVERIVISISFSNASYYALAADNIPLITGDTRNRDSYRLRASRWDLKFNTCDRSAIIEFMCTRAEEMISTMRQRRKMFVHATRAERISRRLHASAIILLLGYLIRRSSCVYRRNRIRPLYMLRRALNRRSSAHENYTPPRLARVLHPPSSIRVITIGI